MKKPQLAWNQPISREDARFVTVFACVVGLKVGTIFTEPRSGRAKQSACVRPLNDAQQEIFERREIGLFFSFRRRSVERVITSSPSPSRFFRFLELTHLKNNPNLARGWVLGSVLMAGVGYSAWGSRLGFACAGEVGWCWGLNRARGWSGWLCWAERARTSGGPSRRRRSSRRKGRRMLSLTRRCPRNRPLLFSTSCESYN